MSLQITAEELASSPDKYLDLANEQDIYVTRNGKDIAKITGVMTPKMQAWEELKKLRGILPPDTDLDQIRMERILK